MQDLAAAVLRAPFLDLFNAMIDPTQPLTTHEYDEWGDPGNEEELQAMVQMCAYLNVKTLTYPPVLLSCATNDARVPIYGPARWVAKARASQQGHAPILLSPQQGGGHFGDETAEVHLAAEELAFMLQAVST